MENMLKQAVNGVLDIIYPPVCSFCGKTLFCGETALICRDCTDKLSALNPPVYIEADGLSLFSYEGEIRQNILRLKYDGRKDIGEAFGFLLAKTLADSGVILDFDSIIPVPLSKKRFKKRGYNQSKIAAEKLSQMLKIPLSDGLVRIKETTPQSKLDFSQRQQNVKGVFGASRSFKGEKLLLIDDIYTTGSTISNCRDALYAAGAEKVFFLTFAKTDLKKSRTKE